MKQISMIAAAFLIAFMMFAGKASAYEFSADLTVVRDGKTFHGRFFVSGNKARSEIPDMKITTIIRNDKKLSWTLYEDTHVYKEAPEYKHGFLPVEEDPAQIEKALAGKELFEGKSVTKYKVTFLGPNKKDKFSLYQWFLDENNLPVKYSTLDGKFYYEFRNVVKGGQPDRLFAIPAGYKKMAEPQSCKTGGGPHFDKKE